MTGRISGAFPGGPRRSGGELPQGPFRLAPVAEIEAARAARRRGRARKLRKRRVALGLAAALASALVAGGALGHASRTTAEELRAAREAQSADALVSQEVNRVLMQLWKMEDLEALRGLGPGR